MNDFQTVKTYLSQAWRIDQHIQAKMEQKQLLRDLATKASGVLSDTPRCPSPNLQPMETIVSKMCDLDRELNQDIDALVDLKRELADIIKRVDDQEQRIILEKRYLCFDRFEQIAVDMKFSIRKVYQTHDAALETVAMLQRGYNG